jgi:hypothetical protein
LAEHIILISILLTSNAEKKRFNVSLACQSEKNFFLGDRKPIVCVKKSAPEKSQPLNTTICVGVIFSPKVIPAFNVL